VLFYFNVAWNKIKYEKIVTKHLKCPAWIPFYQLAQPMT